MVAEPPPPVVPPPAVQSPAPSPAPIQLSVAPTIWAALMPAAGPWTPPPNFITQQASLTPLEVLAGGVELPPEQGGAFANEKAAPTVRRFVAPRIESDGSPVGGLSRGVQLMNTAVFIGALTVALGAFIGWRRNRI
jgi:hypothetical protein